MSTSKIHIKTPAIELNYEGSEEFLKTELAAFLQTVASFSPPPAKQAAPPASPATPAATTEGNSPPNGAQTTGSIAAKLGVSSGPELAKAAAYRLTVCQGKDTFSRLELTEEMRSASQYFKETYRKNLSATLDRLVADDVLLERSPGVYAMQGATVAALKSSIGG
jgi:hypothetical protein